VPAALCVSIVKTSTADKPIRAVKQRLRFGKTERFTHVVNQKMTRYDYAFARKPDDARKE